jgi:nucleoside-diphosphate-sugar epimerase
VLNNFMGSACATGRVEVFSDGAPWRPVIHVQDVARAFEMMLTAPIEKIHNEAFNIGADKLNYQIRDLAEIAARTVPGCELVQARRPGADQRTYRAGFDKFSRTFPDFSFRWTAEEGARQLYESFRSIGLTAADFVDKRFTRLQWLRHLVDRGLVDNDLFWTVKAARAA